MSEVEFSRDGAVQTIKLNRPEKLNAFTRALHMGLQEALRAAADPEVRAVVLTGEGRGFSAGQDLTEFSETGDVGTTLRETYHVNIDLIRSLEKPVIAAVNGVCAGAGLSLATDATSASRATTPSSCRASSASG
jgi:2-(1,2-epoxy-1,2-dihydrophenyl)acetyl-CoA isomerase